jgi:hypothetical protein
MAAVVVRVPRMEADAARGREEFCKQNLIFNIKRYTPRNSERKGKQRVMSRCGESH